MFRRDFLSKMTFGLYAGSILGPKNLASTNNDKSLRDMLEKSETLKLWNTDIYFSPTQEEMDAICRPAQLPYWGIPVSLKMIGKTNKERYDNILKDMNTLVISQVSRFGQPSRQCMDKVKTILIVSGNEYGLCAYNKTENISCL